MKTTKKRFSRMYLFCVIGICYLAFIFGVAGLAHSGTTVDSNIISDTTWTKAGSPYLITQSIDVYPDVTLTIEPGVEVKFCLGCDLEIYGELIAIGNENEIIIFTAVQIEPYCDLWGSIIFNEGAISSTWDDGGNYISGSIIKYCEISYGHGLKNYGNNLFISNNILKENRIDNAILYNQGNSIIANNFIHNNTAYESDWWSSGGAIYNLGDTEIVGNTIDSNDASYMKQSNGGGIYNNGKSIINNNIITNNKSISYAADEGMGGAKGAGICNKGSYTIITDNIISNNICSAAKKNKAYGGGIYNSGDYVTIENNKINHNTCENNTCNYCYDAYGGGLYNNSNNTVISNNEIADNVCSSYGYNLHTSGIYNIGNNTMNNMVFIILMAPQALTII
jgi:hypothetical protein